MSEQQQNNKFRYVYNGHEVSKEEFEKLSGETTKWFEGNSIFSVPFDSFDDFFDGDFKSSRQINEHLDSVLDIYKNKVTENIINKPKCSPQCFCDRSCKKPQEKSLGGYKIPNVKVNATRHKAREEGKFHKDDIITNSNRGEKDTMDYLNKMYSDLNTITKNPLELDAHTFPHFPKREKTIKYEPKKEDGVKETEGKLNYELDWQFIQQLAERMSQNKGKYEPYNWTKPMDVEKLKQSLFRHVIEVMKGNYSDDGREFGHWESIALNVMMINYQLKNNK